MKTEGLSPLKQIAGDHVREERVGDGMTQILRETVSVSSELDPSTLAGLGDLAAQTATWEYQAVWLATWLESQRACMYACPLEEAPPKNPGANPPKWYGDRSELCCGARCAGYDTKMTCAGGNWRERIDPEWYLHAINRSLSQVNRMFAGGNMSLAVAEALELGELVAAADLKFGFERDALRGRVKSGHAHEGGDAAAQARRGRILGTASKTCAEKVDHALDALGSVLPRGALINAYRSVASETGETIEKVKKAHQRHGSRGLPKR